jgi:hypothetical protein
VNWQAFREEFWGNVQRGFPYLVVIVLGGIALLFITGILWMLGRIAVFLLAAVALAFAVAWLFGHLDRRNRWSERYREHEDQRDRERL